MSNISKQLMIQNLLLSPDVHEIIKAFLFYTEETSPTKRKMRECKSVIVSLFTDGLGNGNNTAFFRTPRSVQVSTGYVKWCIMISRQYTIHKYHKEGFVLSSYNCQRCGDYYKDDVFKYTGKIIPHQIECKCGHIDIYSCIHFDTRG